MLKKLGIGVAALAVVGGGVLLYFWQQATALPEWYEPEMAIVDEAIDAPSEAVSPPGGKPDGAAPLLAWDEEVLGPSEPPEEKAEPAKAKKKPRRRRGTARNFHKKALSGAPSVKAAAKASRAEYKDGRLEVGIVFKSSDIDRSKLNPAQAQLLERALRVFPALRGQAVYIGLEDEPEVVGGTLQLGPSAKVKVGKLTYPIGKVAKRLGYQEAQIRRTINKIFRKLDLRPPG